MFKAFPACLAAFALPLVVLLASQSPLRARKSDLSTYDAVYADVANRPQGCKVCHFNPNGKGPRNLFGRDYQEAGKTRQAFAKIEQKDSDGDEVSNIEEIRTGHFPGDLGDKPNAEELKTIRGAIAAAPPAAPPAADGGEKTAAPPAAPAAVVQPGTPVKIKPDVPLFVYDGTLNRSDVGTVVGAWGSGSCEETDERHLEGLDNSLKMEIKGLYEGGRLDFGRPVDFADQHEGAYLVLAAQFPQKVASKSGVGLGGKGGTGMGIGMMEGGAGMGMEEGGMGMEEGGTGMMEEGMGMMGEGMEEGGAAMGPGGMMGPGPGMGPGGMMGPGAGMGPGGMMGPGAGMGPGGMMGPGAGMGPGGMVGPGEGMGPGGMVGPGEGMGPGGMMGPGEGMGPGGMRGGRPAGGGGASGKGVEPKDSAIKHLRIVLIYDKGMRVVPRYPLRDENYDPQTGWMYLHIPLSLAVSSKNVSGNLRRIAVLGDGEGDVYVGQVILGLDPDPLAIEILAGDGVEGEFTAKAGQTVDMYLKTKENRFGLIRYVWDFDAKDGIQEDYITLDPAETVPVRIVEPGKHTITCIASDMDEVKESTTATFTLNVEMGEGGAIIPALITDVPETGAVRRPQGEEREGEEGMEEEEGMDEEEAE